ncbi:MAG: Hpt domain-containing protein, partial [Deltaproteobacteria bacterium]
MNFEALPADEFLEEAQELLQEIEESLLLLEEDPVDQNVIQRLFRSAHTLKGGAAMVGLSDLANYAHEFEAILSQLRSGTLTSTPEIVSVLLKGKDNLSALLNPIVGNSTSSSSHSTNENQPTDQLTDIPSQQEFQKSDSKQDSPRIQKNVYLLHFHFDQSFLEQGQEPLLLIRQLEELGETTVIVHTSQIPPWTEFDPQKLYLWWSIKLVSEKKVEEIDELLEFYRGKESDLSIEKVETPVEEAKEVQDAHQNMLQQISAGESVDPPTFAESTKAEDEGPEETVEIPKV